MRDKKWLILVWIGLGFVLRLTDAIDPVHEFFHVLVWEWQGVRTKMCWSAVYPLSAPTWQGYFAGYTGEIILYGILSYIFLAKLKKVGFLFLSIYIVVYFMGPISYDFNDAIQQVYHVPSKILARHNILWYIYGGLAFVLIIITFVRRYIHAVLRETEGGEDRRSGTTGQIFTR